MILSSSAELQDSENLRAAGLRTLGRRPCPDPGELKNCRVLINSRGAKGGPKKGGLSIVLGTPLETPRSKAPRSQTLSRRMGPYVGVNY